ncbi:trichohyalin-like [Cherax quadricarinatus]|uniref:trichohyalin-like n=1 Tax=Cherax quadricarinatus TaxID=27406 RepID=UPI00387ECB44
MGGLRGRKTRDLVEEPGRKDWELELQKREEEGVRKIVELGKKMEERIAEECRKWEVQALAAEARIQCLEEKLQSLKQIRETNDNSDVTSGNSKSGADKGMVSNNGDMPYRKALSDPRGAREKTTSTLRSNDRSEDNDGNSESGADKGMVSNNGDMPYTKDLSDPRGAREKTMSTLRSSDRSEENEGLLYAEVLTANCSSTGQLARKDSPLRIDVSDMTGTEGKNMSMEGNKMPQRKQMETQWEEERARSVFVYGLQEAKGANFEEIKQEEKKMIEGIMKTIGEGNMTQVTNFQRIGWFASGRIRPVRVTFKEESVRIRILQEKARLRDKEGYQRVYLDRDRTQEERTTLKERVQRRKEEREAMKMSRTQTQEEGQTHPTESPTKRPHPRHSQRN